MSAERRPLVAGNWKMNGLKASTAEIGAIAAAMMRPLRQDRSAPVPARHRAGAGRDLADGRILVGGQDCHAKASGAHTGDISAEMLADAGAKAVIVGHSERRADHHESDADVRAKAESRLARRARGRHLRRRERGSAPGGRARRRRGGAGARLGAGRRNGREYGGRL